LKNTEIAKSLAQAENMLRTRDGQINEAGKAIRDPDTENQTFNELNSRLDVDLEELLRHLENITLLNSHLVAELERYSAEDDTVRTLINREPRVKRAKARVEELTVLSRTRTTSPPKSRLIRKSKIVY
jgi:hypothetical protein